MSWYWSSIVVVCCVIGVFNISQVVFRVLVKNSRAQDYCGCAFGALHEEIDVGLRT